MKTLLLSFCLLGIALPASAHKLVPLQSARVISQNIGSYNGGVAIMPIGTGLVGVPITRESNIVVVESGSQRMTWSEVGRRLVVLPVNESIQFYQDGNWYIVVDSKGKKHKFSLVHQEALPAE